MLKVEITLKIQKPRAEVFDAVYNPKKLSQYFTTAGASAPLDEGKTVLWDFADFPGAFPVEVKHVVKDETIVLEWLAGPGPELAYKTKVEMQFKTIPNGTAVTITESGWKEGEAALKNAFSKNQGWTQMLCCLKAFVEYGINLRKGAY